MLEHLTNSPFLYSLSLTLLHFLWQGLLVALVLKSTLLIVNHNKPQLRYALSSLAMIANLLLPIITFSLIYSSELAIIGENANALTLTELIQEFNQPENLFDYQTLIALLPSLLPYLSLLWLTTVTLLASKLLVEIYNVNKLPSHSSIEPDSKLLARFNALVQQINLTITPQLLISLKVDVPMAIGWLKPVVLIPATMMSGLNSAQLEMLILHELAHIRRHDYLVNFLQTLVEVLLFFHPAVLWVSKQMRNEREYCSDDIAVQHCGNAIAYAHTLADTASLCTKGKHHHTIPTMAMAASGGDLKQRVVRLVDHHCAPQNNISKWLASAAIIFSVLLVSSKQLLTVPLLDFWHNEVAFKVHSETIIDQSILAEGVTANHPGLVNKQRFNINLPNNSLAKQLLTPMSFKERLNIASHNKIEQPLESLITEQPRLVNNPKLTTIKNAKVQTTQASPENVSDSIAMASKQQETAKQQTTDKQITVVPPTPAYNQVNAQLASAKKLPTKIATQQNIEPSHIAVSNKTAVTAPQNTTENDVTLVAKKSSKHTSKQTLNNANSASKKQIEALTNAASQPLETSPIWRNAKQLKTVNPIYPSLAKRKGIEIDVQVDFTIDVNGDIKNIQFARQNKLYYFKSSIRSAIKQWRFVPAKVDDQPVESQMTKVFSFNLQS